MKIKKTFCIILFMTSLIFNQTVFAASPLIQDDTCGCGAPVKLAAARRTSAAARSAAFSDISPSDWYYQYIEELAAKGLAKGNPDGTYAPEAPLLVDEFLAFTIRTLGVELPNGETYWAQHYIQNALSRGLVEPDGFDEYNVPITREQIADIVVRASGETFTKYKAYRDIFSDLNLSDKPESILKAIELGVLAGYSDHTFKPKNTATRAEASVMVLRMIDKSYRLELYGDIFFNAKTDLNENKIMKKGKAEEFLMKAVKNTQIRISQNGYALIKGKIPELPEGQFFILDFSFFDRTGTYLAFRSTASIIEGEIIPWPGKYEIETEAKAVDVGSILIKMGITEGESLFNFTGEPTVGYAIYNYFYEADYTTGFIVENLEDDNIEYDFNLTKGMWGWSKDPHR